MTAYLIGITLTACAVLLLRAVTRRRISARACYALWLVLALRLCLPFSIGAIPISFSTVLSQESAPTESTLETNGTQTHLPSPPQVEHSPTMQGSATPPTHTEGIQAGAADNVTHGGVANQASSSGTQQNGASAEIGQNSAAQSPLQSPSQGSAQSGAATVAEQASLASVLIAAGRTLPYIWGIGSILCLCIFAVSYTVFLVRIRRDRTRLRRIRKTNVYISSSVGAPCLAGVIPAVYLTPEIAASPDAELVMIHEYTHLRHGDPVWSLMRTAACIVFWWHPLIWVCAVLSAHDAELACDDTISAKVDTKTRLRYARLLVSEVSARSRRVPVSLSGGQMKERISRLCSEAPQKKHAATAALAAALCITLSACTLLGIKTVEGETGADTSETVENTPLFPDESELVLPSDFDAFYAEASRIYSMFTGFCVPRTDGTAIYALNGSTYQKVTEPGFETIDTLRETLLGYFTEEVTEELLAKEVNGNPLYMMSNGALYRFGGYAALFGYDSAEIDMLYGYSVRDEEDYRLRVTAHLNDGGRRFTTVCESSFVRTENGYRFSAFSLPLDTLYEAYLANAPVNARTIEDDGTEEEHIVCVAQYGDVGGYVSTFVSYPDGIYRTELITEADGVRYFVFGTYTKDTDTTSDYITYRVETKDLAIVSFEEVEGITANGTPLSAIPTGVYTGKATVGGKLCALRIAIGEVGDVHIEQYRDKEAPLSYFGRVSFDGEMLSFTDGTFCYTAAPNDLSPYADMRVYAAASDEYLFLQGETESDFFPTEQPMILQRYEEPARPTPTWQASEDGTFVAYFVDGMSDYIDIYTEENGTYVGSIPYAVLREFPATNRLIPPATIGFLPYMHIRCGRQGDFIWAMLSTDPLMMSSNYNFCFSSDGGVTWRVSLHPLLGGVPTGATFLSEEVGFLMTYTGTALPISIYKTVDGGRTWENCNISYTSEDEAALLRVFSQHGVGEGATSIAEYMGHLRLDAPTFVGNGIGEARLHLIGYEEEEIASLLLATHDAGETWVLDTESLMHSAYWDQGPTELETTDAVVTDGDAPITYYAKKWVFYYGEEAYNMTEFGQTDGITDITPAGNFLVIQCHVNPNISLYGIFDTDSRAFVKTFAGGCLTWYDDDITTAVYCFRSEIYAYDGTCIRSYELSEPEWIDDIRFSEDHTEITVTIEDGYSSQARIDVIKWKR